MITVPAGIESAVGATAVAGGLELVVLEAGGAANALFDDIPGLLGKSQSVWANKYVRQKYAGHSFPENGTITESTGKVLGGSSTVNGMLYNRLVYIIKYLS